MEQKFKDLRRELAEAIAEVAGEAIEGSDRVGDLIGKIQDAGYDICFAFEMTFGFSERSGSQLAPSPKTNPPKLKLNPHDKEFLKNLHVADPKER